MKHTSRPIMIFVIVCICGLVIFGQQPQSTPPPVPTSTPVVQSTPLPTRSVGIRRSDSPFPRSPISESQQLAYRVLLLDQLIHPLYRKPTSKEMAAIAPSSRVVSEYSALLAMPNTGVFRLVPDLGCATNEKVINVSDQCLKYTMPGAGSSFSFRSKIHRIRHLADITFNNERLTITGIFMHGMMTNIGNVPIESVSLVTPGMRFVSNFKPSTTSDGVVEVYGKLLNGVKQDGFEYSKEVAVVENSTYVLRSVAYRGRVARSAGGIAYNELDYDKREDITVAFRVAERAGDGSITIVWKELSDIESPKIKMPKASEVIGEDVKNESTK